MGITLSLDEIDQLLWVGSYPQTSEDIAYLRDEVGIRAILSLQTDADLAERGLRWSDQWTRAMKAGLHVERVPIVDFDRGDLQSQLSMAVDKLAELIDASMKVYLHCTAGINRSPTVAVAYYATRPGGSLDEAMARVTTARRSVPYPDVVERWLAREVRK